MLHVIYATNVKTRETIHLLKCRIVSEKCKALNFQFLIPEFICVLSSTNLPFAPKATPLFLIDHLPICMTSTLRANKCFVQSYLPYTCQNPVIVGFPNPVSPHYSLARSLHQSGKRLGYIFCLFYHNELKGRGVTEMLLKAAIQ